MQEALLRGASEQLREMIQAVPDDESAEGFFDEGEEEEEDCDE